MEISSMGKARSRRRRMRRRKRKKMRKVLPILLSPKKILITLPPSISKKDWRILMI